MITRNHYWVTYGASSRTFGIEVFADTHVVCDAAPIARWMIGRRFEEVQAWINAQPQGQVLAIWVGDLDGA